MAVLTMVLLSALAGSPASDETAAAATIDDFAWMAGHWRGEGLGGQVEEVWSEPLGGTMVGTFRLVKEGQVAFYEIMVLERDVEGVVLRVKHFSQDLTAWEEKADSLGFRLEKLEGRVATFEGLTISRDGDTLDIRTRMRREDGSTWWEALAFEAYRP